MQYQFVRKKQTVHPAVANRDSLVEASVTIYHSYKPGLSNFFGRGPHKLLHNSSRARHLVSCDFSGICYILPNQHIFRKYIMFSLLAKCIFRPGEMASQVRSWPAGRSEVNLDIEYEEEW